MSRTVQLIAGLAIWASTWIGAAVAQEPCASCADTGIVACRACGERPDAVLACSTAMACRACAGSFTVACEACEKAGSKARLRAQRVEAARQFARVADIEALGLRDLQSCCTEHFDVSFATRSIKGRAERQPHRQLHAFARRLETVRMRVVQTFGVDAAVLPTRLRVVVVENAHEHRRVARALTGIEPHGVGSLLENARATTAVLHADDDLRKDAALHGLLAHVTAHLLLDTDDPAWSWLNTGMAHWVEDDATGRCTVCCVRRHPQPPVKFHGGDWRTGTRELLENGELPPLEELVAMEQSDMDLAQHALAFAFVDFAIARAATPATHEASGAALLTRPATLLLRAAAGGEDVLPALTRTFGAPVEKVDELLRAFVREEYPQR